jgi:trigger factor
MLGIKKQDFNPENSVFSFEVTEISDFIPAEQGQELFDNIYGAGVVKSEEEFREKIREEIAKGHENESNYKLSLDIRAEILEQCGIELPDAFLKRWLARNSEKEIDAETMEREYPVFRNDMIWQMLKDTFTKKAGITITEEELTEAAKNAALDQFRRYGINQVPDEHLVDMAKRILENEKEKQRLSDRKTEEKVIDYIKENITLTKKEVNMEDFHKLWK